MEAARLKQNCGARARAAVASLCSQPAFWGRRVPPQARSAGGSRTESTDGAGFCRVARSTLGPFRRLGPREAPLRIPLSWRSPSLLQVMRPFLRLSPKCDELGSF